jgi:hypothetical protein
MATSSSSTRKSGNHSEHYGVINEHINGAQTMAAAMKQSSETISLMELSSDEGCMQKEDEDELVAEPDNNDLLFSQLKGKAVLQVKEKRNLLIAFAKKKPSDLLDCWDKYPVP